MAETSLPLYVGVETVKQDLGVSRAKNRIWYEEACLRSGSK